MITEQGLELAGPHVAAELARIRRDALAREVAEAALRLVEASVELLRDLGAAA